MQQITEPVDIFHTPRQLMHEDALDGSRTTPEHLPPPFEAPRLPIQHPRDQTEGQADAESVSSRVATSFARFSISPRDSTAPPPNAFFQQPQVPRKYAPIRTPSIDSVPTIDGEMKIFTTADLLHLPNLPQECQGQHLLSAEIEQIRSTYCFESWEQACRYLALTQEQLQEVVVEVRGIVDPRLHDYPLWVAGLVFRGLTYKAGLKTPLLIKTFIAEHLRLAASMNKLDSERVDTYLRQQGPTAQSSSTDMLHYTSTKKLHAQENQANARQEKNHTTATKMSRPKTISEYGSAHTLLDWFVEVEAYLEFLDMTAIDQIDVVTSLFRGTIRKWWNRLLTPQKDTIITWPLMKKLMKAEFLPEDYISDFYEELRDIKQTSTVKEYNRRYYALIQDIPNLLPEMAYYHYVAGLKPSIHTFVKVLPSKTLQHAMRQAETFGEAFTETNSPFCRQKFSNAPNRGRSTGNPFPRSTFFKNEQPKRAPVDATRDITCYNCNKKWHYANKCRQPKKPVQQASVQKVDTRCSELQTQIRL